MSNRFKPTRVCSKVICDAKSLYIERIYDYLLLFMVLRISQKNHVICNHRKNQVGFAEYFLFLFAQ